MPDQDPYQILGLPFGASDAEIAKAYRQLARTLHPDKLASQNLTALALERAAVRFHELQWARAFLLDPEHAADKLTYHNQRASTEQRQRADALRDRTMSERRKRLRTELQRQEQQEQQQQTSNISTAGSKQQAKTTATATKQQAELERQGRELREEYGAKVAHREREQDATQRERRQIRLKWSRKKLQQTGTSSPSEDSMAQQLTKLFGTVESVQWIGSKGNAALVTFQNESSCDRCVQAYATSEVWRASHVNPNKQQQQNKVAAQPVLVARDRENVQEWKVRQAAERERLLQQLVDEETGGTATSRSSRMTTTADKLDGKQPQHPPFPPDFPSTADFVALSTPLEKLEHAEQLILGGLIKQQ